MLGSASAVSKISNMPYLASALPMVRGEGRVSETWNYQPFEASARDRWYVRVLVEVALLRDLQVLGQRAKLLEEAQQVDQLLLRRRLEL
jgi:hypothetical protein